MIETVTIIDEKITKTRLDIGINSCIAQTLHLEIRTSLYQNTNYQRHQGWVLSSDSPGARVLQFVLPRKYTNAAPWVYVTTSRFRWSGCVTIIVAVWLQFLHSHLHLLAYSTCHLNTVKDSIHGMLYTWSFGLPSHPPSYVHSLVRYDHNV